jgi:hypothetical protein
MKTTKVILCASALAIAGLLAVPMTHAAEPKSDQEKAAAAAERKAKKEAKDAEDLAKYDANKNGKLDSDERTAMRLDAEKEKQAKQAEKEAKAAAKRDKGKTN